MGIFSLAPDVVRLPKPTFSTAKFMPQSIRLQEPTPCGLHES